MPWFVVETTIASEKDLKDKLGRCGLADIIPLIKEVKEFTIDRRGLYKQEDDSFLPGYILVRIDAYKEALKAAQAFSQKQVGKFLGVKRNHIQSISQQDVDRFSNRIEEISKKSVARGDEVEFTQGVYEGFTGRVWKVQGSVITVNVKIHKSTKQVETDILAVRLVPKTQPLAP